MLSMTNRPLRLGVLTPSSNTALEPLTSAIVATLPDCSAHFARFKVTEIALSEQALGQFDDSKILAAAELLAEKRAGKFAGRGAAAAPLKDLGAHPETGDPVHVMAGRTDDPRAEDTFLANLTYACQAAEPDGITILIEPLNPQDAPGYFLKDTAQAVRLIQTLDHPRLRLMFDCYHVARVEGDVCARFAAVRPLIGHVQIAGVPARGRPDRGDVDYGSLLPSLGWPGPIGAEYRPGGATEDSLGWLALWRGR